VPIRRSVSLDYVVCLECGWRGLSLRRHIRERHGLSADEYRTRWKLPLHHALVAPAYSERRSEIAKHMRGRPSSYETFDQDGGEEKPSRTPVPSQGDRKPPTRLLDTTLRSHMFSGKSALGDDLMLKIELTRRLGWDSPALTVIGTMDGRLGAASKSSRASCSGNIRESTRERRERLSHPG
jgi:hypothetical protein